MLLPADLKIRSAFNRPLLPALVLFMLVLGGCGYNLAYEQPNIFNKDGGSEKKTLKVKEVDYPTLQPWLPAMIRSTLRDEINASQMATWVDSGASDYEITIKVISFTNRGWIQDYGNQTMLYNTSLTLEAVVYHGSTNEVVWTTKVSYSDRTEQANDELAAGDICRQAIRKLIDQMTYVF